MEIVEISEVIKRNGFFCWEDKRSLSWEKITGGTGGLVCAEKYKKRFGYTGVSLFLHRGKDHWYILLHSPQAFRLDDPDVLPELIIGFLSRQIPIDTRHGLAEEIITKYSLVDVTLDLYGK